jgi:peptide/nickel transport system substrate-binding protein
LLSKLQNPKLAAAVAIVSLTALLSACGGAANNHSPGTLVIALESGPTYLDPRYATDADSDRIGALVFDALARPDRNFRLQPELAESWQALDERTYVFKLRAGVRFQNGRPLTAADVVYTYRSVLDAKTRSPKRGQLRFIDTVEASAPDEVRFHLAAPFAPFFEALTLGVVPQGTAPNTARIGSGPFSVEEFLQGERIALRANPSYWGGAPRLTGVVFKVIPDAIVRVLEFRKGTVDLIQNYFEPDMLAWLEKNSGAAVQSDQGTNFQYIGMNLEHPILKHRAVREAIACAIDRGTIIRHLLKSLAIPATGLLSPQHWAYEPAVPQIQYDPARAKRLLDAAGFRDPDGDGPLPRFKLSFKTTNVDLRKRIAEAFKEQLARVGIELEVRTYEWGTFYADVKKGNFHLYSLEWIGVVDPDIYFNLFHSTSVPPDGNNRGRYRNPELDDLLERGREAMNQDERRRIYGSVQEILARDLPYIPLWWWRNVVVMQPSVRDFELYPDGKYVSLKKVSVARQRQ